MVEIRSSRTLLVEALGAVCGLILVAVAVTAIRVDSTADNLPAVQSLEQTSEALSNPNRQGLGQLQDGTRFGHSTTSSTSPPASGSQRQPTTQNNTPPPLKTQATPVTATPTTIPSTSLPPQPTEPITTSTTVTEPHIGGPIGAAIIGPVGHPGVAEYNNQEISMHGSSSEKWIQLKPNSYQNLDQTYIFTVTEGQTVAFVVGAGCTGEIATKSGCQAYIPVGVTTPSGSAQVTIDSDTIRLLANTIDRRITDGDPVENFSNVDPNIWRPSETATSTSLLEDEASHQ